MNSLLLGYFTSVLIVLFLLANFNNLILDFEFVQKAIICLSILFFLNIFGLLFVGDNGAYLISILVGYILIKFSNENFIVSPYFIAVLLWYPAYENLFSIIRKMLKKYSPSKPDNNHLHQLIFKKLKQKLKFKKEILNTFTGILINLYNLFIFLIAVNNFSNTKILALILIVNMLIYTSLYAVLKKGA